jgi:two-component system, OmpR family, sensor kinase
MSIPLHTRLTFGIGVLLTALAVVLAVAIAGTAERYHAEVSQRLNGGIPQYITHELSLLNESGVDAAALKDLAQRVMTVNPSVEVYLLAPNGRILDTLQPRARLARGAIELGPVHRFLASADDRPLYGDDPSDPKRQGVFAAAPIELNGELAGYLYVVFASERFSSIAAAVRGNYSLQLGLIVAATILLATFIVAALLFRRLTLPLRRLARDMDTWDSRTTGMRSDLVGTRAGGDEITLLEVQFGRMATRIHSQLEELKARDTTRRELVASVSHDLRTPLASLRGYLETVLLKDAALSAATRRQYLEVAQRHAGQLERLIAALFELSKLESGMVAPNFEAFALGELLHDVALRFRLRAQQLGIELLTRIDPATPLAHADVALVERILENLLDNALRHTPAGGVIEIRLTPAAEHLYVAVSDSGVGIAPTELPHVFDRFYSGGRRGQDGLGLAIVRRIVELHGASISLNSTPGVGTRVEFSLPRAPRAQEDAGKRALNVNACGVGP